ncbi:MAG TPA: amidase [Polyangia bacterium]|nr:amidase [Polyangia bacterium]
MLFESSIAALGARLRKREISPVEVVDASLARIERLNGRLNAFITVLAEPARRDAAAAEAEIQAGRWRGPLHGIPVAIKDFYDTAGVPTTAAFEKFENRVPRADAVAVAKLRAAGAIVVGKTNMHRLGMGTTGLDSAFGPARNPWNERFIPGGSSSGSAAAVAAGLCHATLDTDAVGSCRLPAACCGVVGFKGTYGLISSKGILDGEPVDPAILWLSHPGVTARLVEDAAVMARALADSGTCPTFRQPRRHHRCGSPSPARSRPTAT